MDMYGQMPHPYGLSSVCRLATHRCNHNHKRRKISQTLRDRPARGRHSEPTHKRSTRTRRRPRVAECAKHSNRRHQAFASPPSRSTAPYRMCLARSSLRADRYEHSVHAYGRSPVCVRSWRARFTSDAVL